MHHNCEFQEQGVLLEQMVDGADVHACISSGPDPLAGMETCANLVQSCLLDEARCSGWVNLQGEA